MNDLMQPEEKPNLPESPHWLDVVRKQAASIHFGVIQIVIHDSRVVQIEATQKVRIESDRPKPI
ncbi:MAG: YezD family protein [Verrucomicrobia bacterium]|nr:YezD family protein [Verrucomicrobiota bacterium]